MAAALPDNKPPCPQAALKNDDEMVFDVSYETSGRADETMDNMRDVKVENLTVRCKARGKRPTACPPSRSAVLMASPCLRDSGQAAA